MVDQSAATAARERLYARLAAVQDLPALGTAVTRAVQLASSDSEPLQGLTSFVLSDVALTQRVLRLANSVSYRPANGVAVTTVSKAIMLLGFETVRTCALAMLLIDRLGNRDQAERLRTELGQAMVASVVARRLARETLFVPDEEAAIAALFRNLGRVLLAACDHALLSAIESDAANLVLTESQAATRHIGCGLEEVSRHMLAQWGIPESVCAAVEPVAVVPSRQTDDLTEWMHLCVNFSADLASRLPGLALSEAGAGLDELPPEIRRYLPGLGLNGGRLKTLLRTVQAESLALCKGLGLTPDTWVPPATRSAAAQPETEEELAEAATTADRLIEGLRMQIAASVPLEPAGREASGKPTNARELLLAAVQDVVQSVASGQGALNDMAMMVLEALVRALGFRFSTLFLRDAGNGTYRARLALGELPSCGLETLQFRTDAQGDRPALDLFELALARDADLVIADGHDPKIRSRLPAWYRAAMPAARSFVVLPLIFRGKPLGLFYADRVVPAPEGMSADESALLRTLKNQVLARLNATR